MWSSASALPLVAVCTVAAASCATGRGSQINCEWREEHASPLDLGSRAGRRHLGADAGAAEDAAIRRADALRGRRSTAGFDRSAYRRIRDACMDTMFESIAVAHAVAKDDVRRAASWRSPVVDGLVMGVFAALYLLVASRVASAIVRTCSGARALALGAILAASFGLAFVALVSGDVWSGLAESIRVGNGHLSYRVDRVPWRQHRPAIFTSAVLLFWTTAAVHARRVSRSTA